MRETTILLFILPLLCCGTTGNFDAYTRENNIKITFPIEESWYITNDFEMVSLTTGQQKELKTFIKLFRSDKTYIENIIQSNTFEYKINRIDVFDYFDGGVYYGVYITFHSYEKTSDYSRYHEENEYWETFNIAQYRIDRKKLIFDGWHF
jgi:hypothetical protein